MPANTSSTLYRIDECPDVMADACVGDDQGNLIFLSIWARDTAVQQFLARLTLGRDEQGLDQSKPLDLEQVQRVILSEGFLDVEQFFARITATVPGGVEGQSQVPGTAETLPDAEDTELLPPE